MLLYTDDVTSFSELEQELQIEMHMLSNLITSKYQVENKKTIVLLRNESVRAKNNCRQSSYSAVKDSITSSVKCLMNMTGIEIIKLLHLTMLVV